MRPRRFLNWVSGLGTALSAALVLKKRDPHDVLGAMALSRATVRKMRQNLWWAAGYNTIAFPIAAGLFYPKLGLLLRRRSRRSPCRGARCWSRSTRSCSVGRDYLGFDGGFPTTPASHAR